jgi:hypothetical protein
MQNPQRPGFNAEAGQSQVRSLLLVSRAAVADIFNQDGESQERSEQHPDEVDFHQVRGDVVHGLEGANASEHGGSERQDVDERKRDAMEPEEQHRPQEVQSQLHEVSPQRERVPLEPAVRPHQPRRQAHHRVNERPDEPEDRPGRRPHWLVQSLVPRARPGHQRHRKPCDQRHRHGHDQRRHPRLLHHLRRFPVRLRHILLLRRIIVADHIARVPAPLLQTLGTHPR